MTAQLECGKALSLPGSLSKHCLSLYIMGLGSVGCCLNFASCCLASHLKLSVQERSSTHVYIPLCGQLLHAESLWV